MLKIFKLVLAVLVLFGMVVNMLQGNHVFDGYEIPILTLVIVTLADLSDKV